MHIVFFAQVFFCKLGHFIENKGFKEVKIEKNRLFFDVF